MGISENKAEWKQVRNWEILKNRHAPYLYKRIMETVTDDQNREELMKYVRRFGNPSRKIIQMLSGVHSRPVCRTTDDDELDRLFWEHVDVASLRRANQNAEYYAEGMGDSFIYIYQDRRKSEKIRFKFIPAHKVKVEWDDGGDISEARFETTAGETIIDYEKNTIQVGKGSPRQMIYNPLIHYRLDDTAPGWGVDIVEPIFDVTIEIGNQICLFLESGYLRAHEQLAVDTGAGDVSPGDVGDVELGSRKILAFPIKAVPLVSADTAEKFFESIQKLAIFSAEQEGIPEGYFTQRNYQGYPPLLRDRWDISCEKWREKDKECLQEAGRLLQANGIEWDPETDWYVFYQEPRGMVSRGEQLLDLKGEISLGLNNPAWFAFTTDDFDTYQEAKDWIRSNVEFDNEFNEAKAARNMAIGQDMDPSGSLSPRQNGRLGGILSAQVRSGALDPDYDGNAGPSMIPRNMVPK